MYYLTSSYPSDSHKFPDNRILTPLHCHGRRTITFLSNSQYLFYFSPTNTIYSGLRLMFYCPRHLPFHLSSKQPRSTIFGKLLLTWWTAFRLNSLLTFFYLIVTPLQGASESYSTLNSLFWTINKATDFFTEPRSARIQLPTTDEWLSPKGL